MSDIHGSGLSWADSLWSIFRFSHLILIRWDTEDVVSIIPSSILEEYKGEHKKTGILFV